MGANDPQGVANLGLRGFIGRICVEDHITLLQNKYISCGPHGLREEDVYHYKLMGITDHGGIAN